jgi:hypothetical protein
VIAAAISAAAIGAAATIGTAVASSQAGKSANSKAGKTSMENTWRITSGMNKAQNQENQLLQPYYDSGIAANTQLNDLVSNPYGMDQYKQDPGYTPMVNSLQDLQATPGYQFALQQGQQGLDNQAAARGGLLSGKQLKATSTYQQGVASQGYQSAWDRAQQAYQSAFSRHQTRISNLDAITGRGFTAGQNQGTNIFNANNAIAGAMTGNANTQMNLTQDNSAIQQGMNNAIGGAVNDFVGTPKVQSYANNVFNPNANSGGNTNLNNTTNNALDAYLPKYSSG